VFFYLHSLFWPGDLVFIYPRWSLDVTALSCLPLVGVLALGLGLVLLARRSRGPLAGFLIFAGTLFPALGFINVYPFLFSFVADHFQYLASIGVIVPCAWGLWSASERVSMGPPGASRPPPRDSRGAGIPVVETGRVLSRLPRRSTERRSKGTPAAWLIHFNLAVTLGMAPDHIQEAVREYEATMRLKPDHWRAHNNLASALLKQPGRSGDAIAEYREALRYNPGLCRSPQQPGHRARGCARAGILRHWRRNCAGDPAPAGLRRGPQQPGHAPHCRNPGSRSARRWRNFRRRSGSRPDDGRLPLRPRQRSRAPSGRGPRP
jgi:hypothetical protein